MPKHTFAASKLHILCVSVCRLNGIAFISYVRCRALRMAKLKNKKMKFKLNVVVRHMSVRIQSHYVFRCIMLFLDSLHTKHHCRPICGKSVTFHFMPCYCLLVHMCVVRVQCVHITLVHFN